MRSCQSWKYFPVLQIQFVFIVFRNIPKLLKLLLLLLPLFHRNISPLLSNLSTMALTKTLKPSKTTTASIIKTRSQSRTPGTTPRTGPNVRTNDRTIDSAAPVAVAARTTGRTIAGTNKPTDVAPVPVDDLFAGRPTTGALKTPPAPRDSDDAKKPAAKPTKGRPKKVAPKAPRKPRADANELVDPMANIHFGDDATGVVTAGGGLARAGGNDPVLANPEQEPEPLDEPQPKKTRRNPNPRRLGVLLAHLARIAQAAMMMTMMRTPTAP